MTWDLRAQVLQTLDRLRTNPASAAVALLAVLISLGLMRLFSRAQRFEVAGKHCYIGGGSEGLGLSLACQLADRGAHVTIVSRSQSKLDNALQELETHRQNPSQVFQALSCDLTDPAAAASTLRKACKATLSSSPDYLFACAGGCVPGYFAEMSAEQHWQCMEWNFRTCLNTVHEGVKAMKEDGKKGGRVVLTSSVLALMSFAGYSSYSPSKYAIRGLAEALRNELQLYGISVHLFLPATIFSPGFENEQRLKPEITKKIEGPDEGMKPDAVAKELIKGVERGDFYLTYEPVGHMLRNSRGITPRNNVLFDSFWALVGTIAFPIWRRMSPDGEVSKEAKRIRGQGRMTVNYTGGGRSTHRRKPVRRAIDVTGTPSYQTTSANQSIGARFTPLRPRAVSLWEQSRALRGVDRGSARPTFDFQFAQEAEGSPSARHGGSSGRSSVWEDPWQAHLASRAAHNETEREPGDLEQRRQRILQQRDWLNLGQTAGGSRPRARQPRSDVYLTGERSVSPPEDAMLRGSSVYPEEPSSPTTVSIRLSSPPPEIRSVDTFSRTNGSMSARSATPPRTDAFSTAFAIVSPQKKQPGATSGRLPSAEYLSLARQQVPPAWPPKFATSQHQDSELPTHETPGSKGQADDFLSDMAKLLDIKSSPAAAKPPRSADQASSLDLVDFPSSAPETAVSSAADIAEEPTGRSPVELVPETPEGSQTMPEEALPPTRGEADLPKLPESPQPSVARLASLQSTASFHSIGEDQHVDFEEAQTTDALSKSSPSLDLSQYTWPPSSPPRHLRYLYNPEIHHLPDKLHEGDLQGVGGVILVHERLGLGCDSIDQVQAREMLSREFAMRHSAIEPFEWGWKSDGDESEAWGEEDELDEDGVDEGYIPEQDVIKPASPLMRHPRAPLLDGVIFDPFDDAGILEP
ncbi:oxidoreductase [Rhodotorula toruloides]